MVLMLTSVEEKLTAAITLTAFVTIAVNTGSEANAQAADMTNATAAASANMTQLCIKPNHSSF